MSDVKPTRKGSPVIKVYCLPEEKEFIEQNARKSGHSTASFLRKVGQGYEVRAVADFEKVRELARMNGDLGRLGGLLKLWLTDEQRAAQFGEETIKAVLARISKTQDEMGRVMRLIVSPEAKE